MLDLVSLAITNELNTKYMMMKMKLKKKKNNNDVLMDATSKRKQVH